ncbi:MAG: helix-turn-helix transcriptional regulator [Candidatus Accumulibacter sp.]|uniref:helix-turn-helix domain-containing protein n=1 Tax=Accumulibacter sp. TaxID=2053492 RepID=UPI001AD00E3C|nr:helix-turn-helix domain-containing protein [Accumulibacter sp.]MBN8518744.1 helix-turn-helix transcriptional regulator [Accumulibacter sp.]MBO3711250.1 helix-turn-helix transcriptional regulator [Accumulibacter sp.]
MSTFSERLREERKRLGLSQTEFAKAVGVHLNTQSRYEKGHTEPDMAYLEAISQAGVDVVYVLSGMARGFSEEEAKRPEIRRLIGGGDLWQGEFDCDFFLEVLGITKGDWEDVVRRNLRRWDSEQPSGKAIPGVVASSFSSWGPEIARASRVIGGLIESASSLDSALLSKVLEGLDEALSVRGETMPAAKKAQAVAMLYRSFKASGKVDPAMIEEAVKLALG